MIRVTYIAHDGSTRTVEGHPGQNVMEVAVANRVAGIDGDCGGSMACGTCHVFVAPEWREKTGPAHQHEADLLCVAIEPGPGSRLGCQIALTDDLDGLIVRTPQTQKA